MGKGYDTEVVKVLQAINAREILDAPSGGGWLPSAYPSGAIDAIDLFPRPVIGYRATFTRDLNAGIPSGIGPYDAVVSCEGIEHLANPGLFFSTALQSLKPGGTLIVTTPNTWYPQARLKYFYGGFFPGFPASIGRENTSGQMHIIPWSWPQLYTHMTLTGFSDIELHPCIEPHRNRLFDRALSRVAGLGYTMRARQSDSEEERTYWSICASDGALLARRLVVSGRRP